MSPVIGVILMVAITVILAAIIGTFVLGLGENVQQNASAGVSNASAEEVVTLNSLGPSTEGIRCSGDADQTQTEIGQNLDCSSTGSNSVVAYGPDVSDSTVFTFEEDITTTP